LGIPNPFNPKTTLKYHLYETSQVSITIFGVFGTVEYSLFHGSQSTGPKEIQWDGINNQGVSVPSGIYFLKIQTESSTVTNKIKLLNKDKPF